MRWGPRRIDLDLLAAWRGAARTSRISRFRITASPNATSSCILCAISRRTCSYTGMDASVSWRRARDRTVSLLAPRMNRRGLHDRESSHHDSASSHRRRRSDRRRQDQPRAPAGAQLRQRADPRAGRRESVPRALLQEPARGGVADAAVLSVPAHAPARGHSAARSVRHGARRRLPARQGSPVRAADARRGGVRALRAGVLAARRRCAACPTW